MTVSWKVHRRIFLIIHGAVVWSLLGNQACLGELRVGVARRLITPDPLLPISGGMGPSAPATEKQGELTATALVLAQGEVRVAIVGVDLLGFPSVLGDRARKLIPRIPASHILIGASHTHSGPDCYAFPDGKGGHTGDLLYMDSVCCKVAAAVNEALDNMRPANLRIATGEVEGKVAYNYYAPDLYDRRASIVQAVDPAKQVIATLVNYAIHPEVLGADQGLCSPDLIGPMRDRIESRVGGVAMFMNGAQGGMVTADNRDLNRSRDALRGYWDDDRTWGECLRIGNTLADECLRIVGEAGVQTDPPLACEIKRVKFPVESDVMWQVVLHSPLGYPHNEDRSITAQINLLRIGNARILSIPGEALPNIGYYLKRKLGGEHNLLFGLTNDAFGYIMTKVDFHSFPRYDYISRTSLGELTGEILIHESLELVSRLEAK